MHLVVFLEHLIVFI